jgi:hypothetical protein
MEAENYIDVLEGEKITVSDSASILQQSIGNLKREIEELRGKLITVSIEK